MKSVVRRKVAGHLQKAYGISERRACSATGFQRSSQRYRKRSDPQVELRMRLKELAAARVRYGYRRLHILLQREGWPVNRKRGRRLYRLDGLELRMRVRRRKHQALHRGPAPAPVGPAERWGMDFVHD